MKSALHFKRLCGVEPCLQIMWNGESLNAAEGESIAACLLANGILGLQGEDSSDPPRGPFCMMGACYSCRVVVHGLERQACMVEVEQGMQVSSVDLKRELWHAGS